MYASFNSTKSKPLVEAALAGRNLRQQLISSNIANIDTPFYKSRDVEFETALVQKANEIYNRKSSQILQLAQTNQAHLDGIGLKNNQKGTIYLRDGHLQRNDANTVDLDVETTELSKNAIMVNALDQVLKKQGMIFKSVLDASAKV